MGLGEQMKELNRRVDEMSGEKEKKKKFRMPFKGKISKMKVKQGFVIVIIIQDNKNIEFRKERIVDGTYKIDDTFHALDEKDIFFYKGKPMVFQPKRALNPYNPLEVTHETYGQKYVMARMEGDKISMKKQMGWGLTIGGLIIGAIILYSFLTGA